MLHADRPWRVKRAHKAQQQPEEMEDDEGYAAAAGVRAAASKGNANLDLSDSITNQEEMDEAVNSNE